MTWDMAVKLTCNRCGRTWEVMVDSEFFKSSECEAEWCGRCMNTKPEEVKAMIERLLKEGLEEKYEAGM